MPLIYVLEFQYTAYPLSGSTQLFMVSLVQHTPDKQVFLHGQLVVQTVILIDDSDPLPDLLVLFSRLKSADLHSSRRRRIERAEHVDRRGLARAVDAQKAKQLPTLHLKTDVVHCLYIAKILL